MAKLKRKISSTQRDKLAVETAKILKKKGILSKQTKLHGGKYISRKTLKRVQEFQHVAKPSYRAVQVPRAVARAAKAEGYQVVQGNRVIVPAEHDFIKRVRRGEISGLKPVKGGFMSEVTIPFGVDNSQELLDTLQHGNLDDLKLPHERFAFSFYGNMSYRSFATTEQMRQYLENYKQDDVIKALKVYRLHPEDERRFILSRDERARLRKRSGAGRQDSRGNARGRSTYAEKMRKLDEVNPTKAARIRAKNAEKSREQYAERKKDPAYMERAKQRALASYRRRHPK